MQRNAAQFAWLAGFVALALIASAAACAWGPPGHETVGAIAAQLIAGRRAEAEVRKLLQPSETLANSSTWADCANGYCGPLSEELREFVRMNPRHAHYHYTDVPFQSLAYAEGGVGTSDEDIVHILKQCIAVLKGASERSANPHGFSQRQALLLLVHLVGDIHQPLHVGPAYVSDKDVFVVPTAAAAVDNGTIFKTYGDNDLIFDSVPLHGFWDRRAVEYAMQRAQARTPQEFAATLMRAPPDMAIVNGDVTKWPAKWATETLATSKAAHDGLTLQKRAAGKSHSGNAHFVWTVSAPPEYGDTAAAIAATQLTRAGYRLAAVLEAVWH